MKDFLIINNQGNLVDTSKLSYAYTASAGYYSTYQNAVNYQIQNITAGFITNAVVAQTSITTDLKLKSIPGGTFYKDQEGPQYSPVIIGKFSNK